MVKGGRFSSDFADCVMLSRRRKRMHVMHRRTLRPLHSRSLAGVIISSLAFVGTVAPTAHAQQASVSAWDAAEFRIWGYIPYWATSSQISGFASNGMYTHVSDVLYFGGLRTDANGALTWASSSYQTN